MIVYPPFRDVVSPPQPTEPWHSIDAQEYPYRHDVVEFAPSGGGDHWYGRWLDIPPDTDVSGLMWRSVPINWPTVPRPAS